MAVAGAALITMPSTASAAVSKPLGSCLGPYVNSDRFVYVQCTGYPNGYRAWGLCEENNGHLYFRHGNLAYDMEVSTAACAEGSWVVDYGVDTY